MTIPFFSIIIPHYKAEPFLEECLESINQQTFQDFECIVINDGSPGVELKGDENSEEWFREDYKNKYIPKRIKPKEQFEFILSNYTKTRFFPHTKENGGQGTAQNLGLEKIKGKYLIVIDADDFINKKFLEEAYVKLSENKKSIIYYNDVVAIENGRKYKYRDTQRYFLNQNSLYSNLVFPNYTPTIFNYFWPLELIRENKIRWRYPRRGHDSAFYFDCCIAYYKKYNNLKFKKLQDSIYYYRQREGQTTKIYGETILFEHIVDYFKIQTGFKELNWHYYILSQLLKYRSIFIVKKLQSKNLINKYIFMYISLFLMFNSILFYKTICSLK